MEYPWIVGLRYTQRPPVDWQLWAANGVTGQHFILDHGLGWQAKIERQFPDFALNNHRIIWNDAAFPLGNEGGAQHTAFLWNRLDLSNLDTGKKTVVASTSDGPTL